jgi:hypothetical protein
MCATSVPADISVCPQSTAPACKTCCNNAGFAISNDTGAACFCYGTSTLCPNTGGEAIACLNCCTEHGYLAWSTSNDCVCAQ